MIQFYTHIYCFSHISTVFQILSPFRLLQNIEQSSLLYRVGPCWLFIINIGSPGDSEVKNLPTMQETQVRSLGQGDPLKKETAIHSSICAWTIPRREKPGGLQSMESKESGTTK